MKTLSILRQEVSEAKKMKGKDPCWTGYKMLGTKNKGGKQVPNCIPEEAMAEESDAYEKAQENKRSADDAKNQGDMFAHHMHMSDHHENLSQWNYDKGRSNVADSHAKKSEEHHEKAMEMKDKQGVTEEIESIDEISTKGYYTAAAKSRQSNAVKYASSMGTDKQAKTKLDARNAGMKRAEKRTQDDMKKANSGPQKPRVEKEPTEAERRGYGQGRYMGDSYEPNNSAQIHEKNKDAGEYDYEGDMSKSQLRSIIANAQQVHDMLEDNTNMAEWVQSKITLAADYISTVADYMQGEVKEEFELGEAQDINDPLDPNRMDNRNRPVKRSIQARLGHDERGDARVRAGQPRSTHARNKPQLPEHTIDEAEQTDESRKSYYINSRARKDPAVALARKQKRNFRNPPMVGGKNVNLENISEALSARDRLIMAMNREKEKREAHEKSREAREIATKLSQQTTQPQQKIKEGIASLISKNIKKVTATKPTPQQKADIRLNK
jgi:hypothetical protein